MDLQAAKEIIHIISGGIGRNVAPLLNDRDKPFQVAGNVIHICLSDVWPALLQFVEKFIPMFLQDIFVSHVLLDETKRRMHLAAPSAGVCEPSILVAVLFWDIVGWNFPGAHLALIGVERIFHATYGRGFTGLTFLYQLFNTFRVRNSPSRESL
jgi:hypothetical protein